jgi:hypothetical protein
VATLGACALVDAALAACASPAAPLTCTLSSGVLAITATGDVPTGVTAAVAGLQALAAALDPQGCSRPSTTETAAVSVPCADAVVAWALEAREVESPLALARGLHLLAALDCRVPAGAAAAAAATTPDDISAAAAALARVLSGGSGGCVGCGGGCGEDVGASAGAAGAGGP